jgi:peptidoglycan hydrolase-like protein with peptidoglycan-binding domain
MDPDTRAALARFQQQNGLRPTQTLDPPTLAHLTTNQTAGYGSSAPATSTMTPSGDQPNTSAPVGAGGTTQEKSIKRY